MELYEVKIKYQSCGDDGNMTKHKQTYLVEAFNYTDAEAVITQYACDNNFMAAELPGMKPVRYSDIFTNNSADKWYKVRIKMAYIAEDGKEKYTKSDCLVAANTIDEASKRVCDEYKNMDFVSVSISETDIVEVLNK